ncbi:MAG: ABC-F family ATP-binding cassette domain-containing protein [Mogibacterium sp.]|nr:ABC-F family ATP-binding cassette domain-containing protein [Mogibacterium sp.]
MLILSASELNKTYGTDIILEDVSFSVEQGDRIGIVGPNGMGKTTLLSMLAGELTPTSGGFYLRSGYTIGYLRQKNHFFAGGTVIEEAERTFRHFHEMEREIADLQLAVSDSSSKTFERDLVKYTERMEEYEKAGGYTYRSELAAVLRHMGFPEETHGKKISTLSGGERTRLALARMLLRHPDILMLDEPTNHLDLRMLDWLEQYLRGYRGTIIVVSHDRYFLDRIVTRIFDVHNRHLTAYRGNYTEYLSKKEQRLEIERREFEKQQKEIARQEELIRRYKQRGTEKLVRRAQSREKRLAHIDRLDRPEGQQAKMKLSFSQDYKSGNDVALAEDLSMSFGSRRLFDHVSFDIKKGERICIIGENGVGKTTLLRILMGEVQADDGYLRIGHNVDFGYYDQGQLLLNDDETVLGEMKNEYHLYTDTEMRSILGRFLFRGDDVFKEIRALSGGEKAKLSLLKLMLSGANTLVLDEPTNHLDIDSREVVEEALMNYEGTLIIVSHDRYLLQKIPTRILELTDHGLVEYLGKFDYYLEKQAEIAAEARAADEAAASAPAENGAVTAEEERRLRKEQEAEERRLRRKTEALEQEIHALEQEISMMEASMCDPEKATDPAFMRECADKLSRTQRLLDERYEEWMGIQ